MYKPYTGASTGDYLVPNTVRADHSVINHCNYLETENFRLQAENDRLKAEIERKDDALADIASVDSIFVESSGGYGDALIRVMARAQEALTKPEEDGE